LVDDKEERALRNRRLRKNRAMLKRKISWVSTWLPIVGVAMLLLLVACGGDGETSGGEDAEVAYPENPAADPGFVELASADQEGDHPVDPESDDPADPEGDEVLALEPEVLDIPPASFDYRVLKRPGAESHQAIWQGIIGLNRSHYQWMTMSVAFELTNEETVAAFHPKASGFRKLQDRIKDVFRSKTSAELHGVAAMEQCREDLIATLNDYFGATVVRQAYFSDYMLRVRMAYPKDSGKPKAEKEEPASSGH